MIELRFDEAQWTSSTKVPAILHVTQESRYEGLKFYKLSFGRRFLRNARVCKLPATVYYNASIDTIYLGYESIDSVLEKRFWHPTLFPDEMTAAKSVAVEALIFQMIVKEDPLDTKELVFNFENTLEMGCFRLHFPKLESLDLVHEMEYQRNEMVEYNDDLMVEYSGDLMVEYSGNFTEDYSGPHFPDINSERERSRVRRDVERSWISEKPGHDSDPIPTVRSVRLYREKMTT